MTMMHLPVNTRRSTLFLLCLLSTLGCDKLKGQSTGASTAAATAPSKSTVTTPPPTIQVPGALPIAQGGTGATTVQDALANLGLGNLGSAAFLNSGSAAGNLVQLDKSGKLPALDGSQLFNVPAATLTGVLPVAQGGTGAATLQDAQKNLGLGSAATLNAGTRAGNVVQLDDSGKLPGIDGSHLTGVTATSLSSVLPITQGGTGATTVPDAQKALGLGSAATLNAGTRAGNVVQLDDSGKLPPLDGSQLQGVNAAGLTIVTVSSNTGAFYTAGANVNVILADATAQPLTIILPAAATAQGHGLTVKKTDKSSNGITLVGSANQTIDLETKYFVTGRSKFVTLVSDGNNWFAIAGESSPVGAINSVASSAVPPGWLECNGQAVSRADYAALFATIGTTWGVGDGVNTFNLPDLRGRFVRGWDHGAGVDPDSAARSAAAYGGATGDKVGSAQADGYRSHTHGIYDPGHSHQAGVLWGPCLDNECSANPADFYGGQTSRRIYNNVGYSKTGVSVLAAGGNETRPVNVNVMFVIKY